MNPDETFAADRSPFSRLKWIFCLNFSLLVVWKGYNYLGEKTFGSRHFVHDESSQEQVQSGN